MSLRSVSSTPIVETVGPVNGGGGDITEQRPCAFPVVCGFVRLSATRHARRSALETAIRNFCREHELALGDVFIEQQGQPTCSGGPFVGLLAAMADPNIYGVVLPSAAHLGRGETATVRRYQIQRRGARLLLIRGSHTCLRSSNVTDK